MKRFKATAPQLRESTLELSRGIGDSTAESSGRWRFAYFDRLLDSWCHNTLTHQKAEGGLRIGRVANFAWAATQKLVKAGNSERCVLDDFTRSVLQSQACN